MNERAKRRHRQFQEWLGWVKGTRGLIRRPGDQRWFVKQALIASKLW